MENIEEIDKLIERLKNQMIRSDNILEKQKFRKQISQLQAKKQKLKNKY